MKLHRDPVLRWFRVAAIAGTSAAIGWVQFDSGKGLTSTLGWAAIAAALAWFVTSPDPGE